MAGWIKELLLDYGLNRLSIDQRSDISTAISSLISAGVFTIYDIESLDMYISGYNAIEIAAHFHTTTDVIETNLTRILRAIETASGYTDTTFVHRVSTRKNELSLFLIKHGQRFHTHELKE